MRLTDHAREQMQRRQISPKRVERALCLGTEIWKNGCLVVRHGRLRLVVNPYSGYVVTAYWKGPQPQFKTKKRKKKVAA